MNQALGDVNSLKVHPTTAGTKQEHRVRTGSPKEVISDRYKLLLQATGWDHAIYSFLCPPLLL